MASTSGPSMLALTLWTELPSNLRRSICQMRRQDAEHLWARALRKYPTLRSPTAWMTTQVRDYFASPMAVVYQCMIRRNDLEELPEFLFNVQPKARSRRQSHVLSADEATGGAPAAWDSAGGGAPPPPMAGPPAPVSAASAWPSAWDTAPGTAPPGPPAPVHPSWAGLRSESVVDLTAGTGAAPDAGGLPPMSMGPPQSEAANGGPWRQGSGPGYPKAPPPVLPASQSGGEALAEVQQLPPSVQAKGVVPMVGPPLVGPTSDSSRGSSGLTSSFDISMIYCPACGKACGFRVPARGAAATIACPCGLDWVLDVQWDQAGTAGQPLLPETARVFALGRV